MKVTLVALFLFLSAITVKAQVSFGDPVNINDNWKFKLGDIKEASLPGFNDGKWRELDLPHDWSVEGTLSPSLASATGYLPGGIAWYRKTMDIPADKKDKKVYIYFEGVYRNAEVFINGVSMGVRPNGYISFAYELTQYIKFGETNTIAVKVDHSKSADSRWYTGSGIYRDVYLVYANPVHIDLWGVYCTSKVEKNDQGMVNVTTSVKNTTGNQTSVLVEQELLSADNKVIAKASNKLVVPATKVLDMSQTLVVKKAELWSIEKPYLYQLVTKIYEGGQVIDKTSTNVGIRTLSFDPNKGFAINGKNTKVKGVCLHHDAGVLGSAVPREVWENRILTLKSIGCNAIRTSHNPQAPELYELCDKLGMLIFNEAFDEWEFPKKKWIEGWNVGTPQFQGPSEFFEQWGETDLRDMVLRDRNHPSVFMWSIGNEVDYPNDPYSHPILDGDNKDFTQKIFGGYKKDAPDANRLGGIAKRLVAVVKKYDTSRPVSAGLAGVAMSNETEYPSSLDVAGYNYTESRYISDHKKYPNRVIFGSENRHDYDAWKAVVNNEHIFGQFLWTGIDYLGESHTWPSRGFNSGLINLGGDIKPRGYFRQSLWSEKPMVYVGSYIKNRRERFPSIDAPAVWNYSDGDSVRVVCYTNCNKVQLLLNGVKVSEEKTRDDNTGVIYWDIPYKSGKIEAVGYNSNTEAARFAIETSKQPYALQPRIISQSTAPNGISIIEVQVVDEDGKPVFISDNEITCKTNRAVKLEGMEGSDPQDMGSYTDNNQRAFQGKLVVFVRNSREKGSGEVVFTSPWLKEGRISIVK
jgi:hypothetical protein